MIPNSYTAAELTRSQGRHNILVPGGQVPALGIRVRYGYVELAADSVEHAPSYTEVFRDHDGKIVGLTLAAPVDGRTDWEAVAAAVAKIRDDWGDIPCQINAVA